MESIPVSTRRRFALIALFLVAFIVLLNGTTFFLYQRARSHLDNELGARLRSTAAGVAHALELAAPDSIDAGGLSPRLLQTLYLVRDENDLSDVVIMTPDGVTIVDLAGYATAGEINPLVDIDFAAVALARSGVSSHTGLYRAGTIYMKSAYAPVTAPDGSVTGLVGVEAGAAFFNELRGLRRMILAISGASLAVVVVLGFVFFRLSRSLDRAQAAALHNENLAAMGRMVANIAHEVRNPLSIIRTSAARIRRRHGISDEALDYIIEEVDSLNDVLTGYLEFAREPSDARRAPVSAHAVLRRAAEAVRESANERGVRIVPPAGNDATLAGNERRIRQAVLNVLINAVQASNPGDSVRIHLDGNDTSVDIVVQDTGCGIAPEDIPEVTRPFFTRRADGSGLGLNIVETIVREHAGALAIDSRPGEGTTVRLRFPRHTGPAPKEST